jgi:hypothetical protein
MMLTSDAITHWLTTVTTGERYWDLVGDGDHADCGMIKAVNELGFLATVTGAWKNEAGAFDPAEPETAFYPWHSITKIGLRGG